MTASGPRSQMHAGAVTTAHTVVANSQQTCGLPDAISTTLALAGSPRRNARTSDELVSAPLCPVLARATHAKSPGQSTATLWTARTTLNITKALAPTSAPAWCPVHSYSSWFHHRWTPPPLAATGMSDSDVGHGLALPGVNFTTAWRRKLQASYGCAAVNHK